MKKFKLFIALGVSVGLLCGCGSSSSSLVGRWEAVDDGVEVDYGDLDELEFFSDGTYSSDLDNYSGGYSVDGNRIKLSGIIASAYTFSFEVSGNTLTMYDDNGNEFTYNKVDD